VKAQISKLIFHTFLLVSLLAALFGLQPVTPVRAAGTITVDGTADDALLANLGGNGLCDLREAVEAANTDSVVDVCAAGSGADTILFDASLSGATIYLASTLTLTQNVTIDGSALASQITLSGDSNQDTFADVRVFSVNSGVTAILNNLIIKKGLGNGSNGGGIQNNGTLTVTNSTFSSNSSVGSGISGAAIYNNGTLTVTDSTFSGNSAFNGSGGAIDNPNSSSVLIVTNSTFSGNSAYSGGGILNYMGMLTVTNSTFSGNSASAYGGGIYNAGTGTSTITNSTFSGNSSSAYGGGIANTNGTLTVTNSTFSNNSAGNAGGGISSALGTLNYANTIIANSTAGGDCDFYADIYAGTLGTNTNNLVEDGSVGCSAALSGDPNLDVLAYNNGGATKTFALLTGSSAIDAGDNTTCNNSPVSAADQNGVTRPVGAQCDIGATEGSTSTSSVPMITSFVATSPSTSLNIPITSFNASDNVLVTGYKITQSATPPSAGAAGWTASAPTTYTVSADGSYTLYAWAKDQDGNVSVGFTPASVNVDATLPTVTAFAATSPSTSLSIPITTFTASDAIGVTGYMITGTSTPPLAGDSGWAVSVPTNYTVGTDGSYTLYPWAKDAAGNVSAVYGSPVTVSVDTTSPVVTSFTVPSSATSFSIPITAFTASDNVAVTGYKISESSTPPSAGGAGWTASAPTTYTVTSSGFHVLYPWAKDAAGNVSAVYGSPASVSVCVAAGTVTNTNNSGAGSLRQAIADACTGATIDFDSGLSDDTIHLVSTLTLSKDVTIDGSSLASQIAISGDTDSDTVGDVRVFSVDTGVTATLDSVTIIKGYASEAGAIYNEGNLTITNSNISYNSSTGYSGAISSNNGSLTITDSTFYVNTALGSTQGAGAILNNSDMTITGSTFASNTATVDNSKGGAIYNIDPDTTISNSTFSGNAAQTGGAIYTTTSMTIKNSTFSDNSAANAGGLYIDGGTTNLENTIIANSTGGDCINTTIGLGTNITNLIEDGSCFPFLSGDPNLGVLASNGGATQTVALLAGSSAIDAGDDVTCYDAPINNLDQRGTTRPNGGHCDIGAYEYVDTTAPTVTVFVATSPTNSLNIPITSFTASDDAILAGYKITETSTPPSAGAAGWTASPPTTYTVSSVGSYTLYPWAKDVVGNVSAVYGSPTSVTVETTAPTITSFIRQTPSGSPTNADTLIFRATFSEAVMGVGTADFAVNGTTTATVTGVSAVSTSVYDVTVSGGDLAGFNGMVGLNFSGGMSITDLAGNALANTEPGSDQTYTLENTAPTVSSITRVTASPTAKLNVQFLVTFSESVMGITTADFSLTSTVSGASITSVSADSGSTRTVTVSTGSGNGTIRLDIPNTASITDTVGNSLSGLPYTSGQVYTVNKTLTYTSAASQDGWILESTETSNAGGTLNTTGATFLLGDAAADKQYRSILSFNTASLPDNATITSITLKIRRPTTGFLTGNNNPFSWGLGLKADVCKSMFGTTSALQLSDFNYTNTTNCKLLAAAFGSTPSASWYSANLLSTAFAKVNKTGLTQFRLRFAKDDNDDGLADYLSFYSGNATAANRPQLVITYNVP
jgi:hypothetical protein